MATAVSGPAGDGAGSRRAAGRRVAAACLAAVLCAAGARGAEPAAGPSEEATDHAIARAVGYLEKQIGADGACAGEADEGESRHGGLTALCVHALLTAGAVPERSAAVRRAAAWLMRAKLTGTYAVALRACALADMKDANATALLARDAKWLIEAMGPDGGYTYTPAGAGGETRDNSNAQMALMGVWAAARRGAEVPAAYWHAAERYWLDQQQADGGWGYRAEAKTGLCKTYGSMTAAGLASLYICFDMLHADQFTRCTAAAGHKPIDAATAWLAKHFAAGENPGKGVEWHHYWLWCLSRVGLASGRKHLGGRDWHAAGAAALLDTQNADGSWAYGDRTADTALALIFLVRGRQPLLLNKLSYRGQWNARPRDAANLTRWMSFTFERPLGWQVVDANGALADWEEAPLLYVSGAGPLELTGEQLDKLRTFALRGGLIVSEAACNNGDFTLDVRRAYARAFPDWPLERIAAGHPLYSCHARCDAGEGLLGVSNGVRLLAVHAARELSLAFQLGPPGRSAAHDLAGNMYAYATDNGQLRAGAAGRWPAPSTAVPHATIPLARLKYAGNWDPEPLGWQRLGRLMERRQRVVLRVTNGVDIADLDPSRFPVAHITGTGALTLTRAQTDALKKFFAGGGTLIADAAGGSEAFAASFRRLIYPLVPNGKAGLLARDYALYTAGPYEITKVRYRAGYAMRLGGEDKTLPRLRVVIQDGRRLAIIFSAEDLSAGLVGYPLYGLAGYEPDSAERLMTNILFHAAGLQGRPPAAQFRVSRARRRCLVGGTPPAGKGLLPGGPFGGPAGRDRGRSRPAGRSPCPS